MDINDTQWIAELLQHSLHDLIRYRTLLIQDRVREINRVHKVLEDANIKQGLIASEVLGFSG